MPRLIVLVVVLLAFALVAPDGAAQDAFPSATPTAGPCEAPELPPGTPTSMDEGTPAADDTAGMEMGTPESIEEAEELAEIAEQATPERAATPAGTPADQATAERAIAAVGNVVNCLNAGEALAFAALVTPNYLLSEFGTANPYDLPAFLEGLPSQELRSAGDVQTHADGRVSVDLTIVLGGTQVDRFRAYFVERGDFLLVDEEQSLPVEGADATVEVAMLDFAFELSQDTVPADALVAFTVPNRGQYPHEFAVVRLPEGLTVEQVLADPALEEQVQFLGGVYAEPGQVAYFGLDGLEPGLYTAVCFVDLPGGIPHVMRGMVAEFTAQ